MPERSSPRRPGPEHEEQIDVVRRLVASLAALVAATAGLALPAAAPAQAAPFVPASFTFGGSGWGHGVGMSQYGARGMALDGYTGTQIAEHYYTGTTVASYPDVVGIRVNLLHQRTSAAFRSEALVAGGGGIEVTVAGVAPVLGDAQDTWTVVAGIGTVTVRRIRAGVTTTVGTGTTLLVRWAGTRNPGTAGTKATQLNLATSVTGLSASGHRYRYGFLDVATTSASRTTFEAVATLRLHDEYLLGISEVSNSWPAAALQAQVLAARSYALSKYGTGTVRAGCRCHVDSGKGPYYDQTYAGYVKETSALGANWRAAVTSTLTSATTGLAILSGGKPITAFYFSASGGATRSSAEVWGGELAYAQTVDDHWSLDPSVPWSSWTPRVRTQAQVATAFGLPDVVRLDLSSRMPSGAVRTAVAYSSTGATATLSGSGLVGRLSLPSSWVWRTSTSVAGAPSVLAAAAARSVAGTSVVVAPQGSPELVAVASVMAARRGWPLLLVDAASIPAATRAELVRRTPSRVFVVGTAADVSAPVLTDLAALSPYVARIAGADHSEISATVARTSAYAVGTQAMVAADSDPSLAAAAASVATATGRPLLLVPGGATPAPAVVSYLDALAPVRTVVAGSTADVSDTVVASLAAGWRVVGTDDADTSARLSATISGAPVARLALVAPDSAVHALVSAPGTPLVIASAGLPASARTYLQRGVLSVLAAPGVPADVVTLARRA